MSRQRLLVFDIETVPDRTLPPASEGGEKEPFPKTIHHRVIAISFLAASIIRTAGLERYEIEECRSGGTLTTEEPELLRGFWSLIDRDGPRVVSWNGRSFDLPVLTQRALVHGVPMHFWHQAGTRYETYRHRYSTDWACDLMDALGEHGAAKSLKLDETAVAVGMPGKMGHDGSQVSQMYAEGRLDEIRAYCETDVLNLAGIYFRWAYVVGKTDAQGYESAVSDLMQLLAEQRTQRPHLGEFLDLWRVSQRPIYPTTARRGEVRSADHILSDHVAC
jgi:predicted PolB exonuclease-like 3'-5' exonuclease